MLPFDDETCGFVAHFRCDGFSVADFAKRLADCPRIPDFRVTQVGRRLSVRFSPGVSFSEALHILTTAFPKQAELSGDNSRIPNHVLPQSGKERS